MSTKQYKTKIDPTIEVEKNFNFNRELTDLGW